MSYGEDLLGRFLDVLIHDKPLRNAGPEWLRGLELDFYYPKHRIAFEFQGDQHLINTKDFGSNQKQKFNDRVKRRICRDIGVILTPIYASDLITPRLRCIIKKASYKSRSRGILLNPSKQIRDQLNKAATEYRSKLVDTYDSPTARIKGITRNASIDRHNSALAMQ